MRGLIAIVIFILCSSAVLYAQSWEIIRSESITGNSQTPLRSRPADHQFILHDFPAHLQSGDYINLPGPDGLPVPFLIKSSPVLDQRLQNQFPAIQSFSIQSEGINGRLAVDPSGIDVVYTTTNERYAIEHIKDQLYEIYNLSRPRRDDPDALIELGKCLTPTGPENAPEFLNTPTIRRAPKVTLRTYKLAISVTSTYAARHGGTIESILTEINKVFNRVNEVFLRELAVQFQIIEESTQVFFLDKQTDPYTEGNNTLMLNKLDEVLVKKFGRKSYDLGHLLATNCGPGTAGVSAGTGTICEFNKGKALSCDLTNNLEEYVRVLTHELGHQLGANHTWSNCPPNNSTQRTSSTAYEPGSGSSIMSYIGSCGDQNLRYIPGPFYFHTGSLQQMLRYIETGPGSSCGVTEELSNESPQIQSVNIPRSETLYIPIGTPFILETTAEDSDGDALTYAWDQMNTGPIAPLGEPIQSGPSIRSYAPDTTGTRYIPHLSSLIHNEDNPEEVLPTYNRNFTFGLTVRDNHPGGGGLAQEIVSFNSTNTAGPFFIDYPNDSSDQLFSGSLTKIQWNVAGTHEGLVNTEYVVIKMSTDGGKTFPFTLADRTENDGEHDVQIPNIVSDSVRFLIQGYDHVFFDISDQNIPIINPAAPTFGLDINPGRQIICLPQTAKVSVSAFPVLGFDKPLTYSIDNPYPDVEITLTDTQSMVNQNIDIVFEVPETLNSDTLRFNLNAISTSADTISREISLIVINNSHKELALQYPDDNIQGVEVVPFFDWNPSPNADYYTLEVSKSASFRPEFLVISESGISGDSFSSNTILEEDEVYFWRVIPHNKCSTTTDVPVAAFQTKTQDCRVYPGTNLPTGLGASSPGEIVSKIDVEEEFKISDVNVLDLKGFHESVNQLKLILQKDTTQVTLYEGECGIRSLNIDINYDDESVGFTDCRLGAGSRAKPLEPLSAFKEMNSKGTWNLHWQDSTIGAGGIFQAWNLELCGAITKDRLQVITDTLFVAPGRQNPITPNEIEVLNGANALFEWVDSTLYGQLLKNGETLRPGQKWTAADIASGIIQYKNESAFDQEDIILSIVAPNGQWSGIIRIPVKLDETVQAKPVELKNKITISPNPAKTHIAIESENGLEIKQIEIRNIQGNVLYTKYHDFPVSQVIIPTISWPAGMVFVTITTTMNQAGGKGVDRWTGKIIIQ